MKASIDNPWRAVEWTDANGRTVEELAYQAEERLGVPVHLTPAEHRRLKQRALDGDTNMQQLVRNALRAMGLI